MHLPTRALLAVVLFGLSLSIAPSGRAQSNAHECDCDIPQLPLTLALRQFFAQAGGLQYAYLPSSLDEENILVGPLKGHYTLEQALTKLLPEGFTFAWVNERTVYVFPPWRRIAPVMPEGTAGGFVPSPGHGPIQGMLVKGSRLWSLEFELPSLVVFDREDIEALGISTLAEVLEYLPQQPYSRSSGFRFTGEQYADLRGLGSDTTLILINGRRVTASATSFDSNAFDLNTIPVTAVDRMEILLDSMAVAAGADSIGGVINFILRDHYGSPWLEARYGAASGGADELRLSVGADHPFHSLQLTGLVDYFAREELAGAERDLWRNQDFRRFGSADLRSPDSNPGNVTSISPENLPGLTRRFAAVPHHDSGAPLTPEDFVATAGVRNLESAYQYRSIIPETNRLSIVGTARLELPRNASLFGELLLTDRTSTLRDLPVSLSNVLVPATNPFNPFKVPVLANFRLSGIGAHLQRTDAQFARALLGLRHDGARWIGELSVLYHRDSASLTTENDIDGVKVAAALAQTDPHLALNVFAEGPAASAEILRSLVTPSFRRAFDSREAQISAVLRGRLFELPAGVVSTLLGVQYRRPEIAVNGLSQGRAQRSIAAAFAELQLPLIDDVVRSPGADTLALNVSTRSDRYSDLGSEWNSHAALIWHPLSDLMFRASYGTSFRAPSLWELYQPRMAFPFALSDPKRNNELANVTVTVGGNPELEPTRATSWSLGFKLMWRTLANLQLSGSWWHVDMNKRLTPVTLPSLFAREDLFSDRVLRAAPSPADAAAGIPGKLSELDFTSVNVGQLSANGFDVNLSCGMETAIGSFVPSISATWINKFTTIDVPGLAATDRVALASPFGTLPRWRAVARVGWTRGAASAAAALRFVSRYDDFNVLQNRMNGRTIGSQALVDLQASLDISELTQSQAMWDGMRLTAGVTNLFDTGPQFAEAGAYFGYDPSQGDLRQRFAYIRLTKRF